MGSCTNYFFKGNATCHITISRVIVFFFFYFFFFFLKTQYLFLQFHFRDLLSHVIVNSPLEYIYIFLTRVDEIMD
jgi:hypothetical protein